MPWSTTKARRRSRHGATQASRIKRVAVLDRLTSALDLDRRIPMTSATLMPICSISKQFLCLVIASLKHDPTPHMAKTSGDVFQQLTTELGRKMPQLINHVDGELTIAHLYNMQSGIRDYWAMTVLWGAKPEEPFSIAYDAPQALDRTKSFHFAPGTEFSYSNVNFHVLARLVETISGHSLEQLLAERVFIPAGMKTASLKPNTRGPPLPIVGYEGNEKSGYVPADNGIEWSGDAGIVASLDDMIAYERYLEKSWEDKSSTYSMIAEPQTYKNGSPAPYGFGLVRADVAGKTTIGHGGALRGFRLHRLHVPSEHFSVVVMFNHEAVSQAAAEVIVRKVLATEETKAGPAKPAEEWKGSFLDEETQLMVIVNFSEKGELMIFGEKMQMKDDKHAECRGMTASVDGDTLTVTRSGHNRKYQAKRIAKPAESELSTLRKAGYAGEYRCEESDSTFTCTGEGGIMYGSFDGYLGKGPMYLMRYMSQDVWLLACMRSMDAPAPGDWTVVFRRGESGGITGVTIGCWLARRVDYVRRS